MRARTNTRTQNALPVFCSAQKNIVSENCSSIQTFCIVRKSQSESKACSLGNFGAGAYPPYNWKETGGFVLRTFVFADSTTLIAGCIALVTSKVQRSAPRIHESRDEEEYCTLSTYIHYGILYNPMKIFFPRLQGSRFCAVLQCSLQRGRLWSCVLIGC